MGRKDYFKEMNHYSSAGNEKRVVALAFAEGLALGDLEGWVRVRREAPSSANPAGFDEWDYIEGLRSVDGDDFSQPCSIVMLLCLPDLEEILAKRRRTERIEGILGPDPVGER